MATAWVLFVLTYVSGSYAWGYGVTAAEFADKPACEAAVQQFQKEPGKLTAWCVAKSSDKP